MLAVKIELKNLRYFNIEVTDSD